MKLYRVLALALAVVMMGCVLVACDKEPEATETTIKVAFTIKDGADKDSEILAQDAEYSYTYTGDAAPTVIEVLADVCEFYELKIEYQSEEQQYIKSIGGKSAGSGKFWNYSQNGVTDKEEPMYVQTVADGDILVVYLADTKK